MNHDAVRALRRGAGIPIKTAVLAALFLLGGQAQARGDAPWTNGGVALAWTRCETATVSRMTTCRTFPMARTPRAYGVTRSCTRSVRVTVCRTFPRLRRPVPAQSRPPYQTYWLWVTGYSWGPACGDVYGQTADGSPVGVGTVASDNPALWHRHVYVPSLGYSGYVNDRGNGGGGVDLFAPSCGAAYTYTGWREAHVF